MTQLPGPIGSPEGSAVPAAAAGATVPRRVHPVTPLVQAGRIVPIVILASIGVGAQSLGRLGWLGLLILVVVVIALASLVAGLEYLQWQRRTFWFDAQGDFRLDSGVLTRRQRRLQLSRLQGVDVVQPLLARLVGLAAVTIEVAGSGDSRARIEFLTQADAAALRNEVIARAAGLHPQSGEAPERPLVQVPPKDLLVSLLLRGVTVALLLLTGIVVVITMASAGMAGILMLLTGGVPLLIVFAEFATFFNFTVAESPDGLRLRSGLFQTKAQTIPPGRVQAVEFVQSWLWRRRDWVRVRLNVAGLQSAGDDQNRNAVDQVLLPVAPYVVALSLVAHVLPNVDVLAVPLKPAPRRARKRAWIQYSGLGVGHDDKVFVTTRGRFVRRRVVVPHARTQSVRVTQGPWQRLLNLASMHLDSPPGPVLITALHRDPLEARELAESQNRRAQLALDRAGTGKWMGPGPPREGQVNPADPRGNDGPDADSRA